MQLLLSLITTFLPFSFQDILRLKEDIAIEQKYQKIYNQSINILIPRMLRVVN